MLWWSSFRNINVVVFPLQSVDVDWPPRKDEIDDQLKDGSWQPRPTRGLRMLSSLLPKIKRNILRNRPKTFHLIMAMPWFFSRPRYPVTSTSEPLLHKVAMCFAVSSASWYGNYTVGRKNKREYKLWMAEELACVVMPSLLSSRGVETQKLFSLHPFPFLSSFLFTVTHSPSLCFHFSLGCHAQKSFRVKNLSFFLRFSSSLLFRIFLFVRFTLETVSIPRGKVASK